jgi:photosystem II stability/assembly factor-like uncharacterized protein
MQLTGLFATFRGCRVCGVLLLATSLFPLATPGALSPPAGPVAVTIQEIDMLDSRNGWAIGSENFSDCRILHTGDGGRRWQDVTPPMAAPPQPLSPDECVAADFKDVDAAWIINLGDYSTWHTSDGGQSWVSSALPHDRYFDPQYLQFADRQHGWFLSRHDVEGNADWGLYQTNDGGANWQVIANLGLEADYTGLAFFDAQTGWLTASYQGGPAILMTQDSGLSWNEVTPSPDAPNAIDVPNCAFFHPVILSEESVALPALCLIQDASNPEKTSTAAFLLKTSDSGQSWTAFLVAMGNWSWDRFGAPQLQMLNSDLGWMTLFNIDHTGDEMFQTSDGGLDWTNFRSAPAPTSYQFDFVDARIGWAASGSLMRTDDSGRSWSSVNPVIKQGS